MNRLIRKQLLSCAALLCLYAFLQTQLIYANSLPLDEERLPPFSKNTNLFANLANGTKVPKNESQNLFQSSISCGHSEFYVQINFNKPFNGLVYAYKYPQLDEPMAKYYYPVQILETCMLQGNGASVVYLELSFLSECVEKLSSYSDSQVMDESSGQPNQTNNERPVHYSTAFFPGSDESTNSNNGNSSGNTKVNLDGFHFRRAINDNPYYLNISSDETYQLSLYIQNDRQIEQKTDSKVTILCSSRVTKNIIFEQNVSSDYSRKVDPGQQAAAVLSGHRNRTIVPSAQLTVQPFLRNGDNQTVSSAEIIDSRIDILRGSIPFLKIIDSSVELGDDLTLIIRSKEMDGFDSQITNCFSHNGTDGLRQDLTNDDGNLSYNLRYADETAAIGLSMTKSQELVNIINAQSKRFNMAISKPKCTLNSSIMPDFQVMQNTGSESKVYYTTFSAFKFPNAYQLGIQCTLAVCYKPCPKVSCENKPARS